MLHRVPSFTALHLSRHDRHRGGPQRMPVSSKARAWLKAPGSLTARLRQHGMVKVQVMQQGHRALWPQEQTAIRTRSGHVREVVLSIDGRPAVWARSVTSTQGLKGPWRALKGLGTRPLAELLFEHRGVRRDPLYSAHFARHSPTHNHLRSQWLKLYGPAQTQPSPHWSRRSVFWHKGQPLQVMECFAPWVLPLSVGRR